MGNRLCITKRQKYTTRSHHGRSFRIWIGRSSLAVARNLRAFESGTVNSSNELTVIDASAASSWSLRRCSASAALSVCCCGDPQHLQHVESGRPASRSLPRYAVRSARPCAVQHQSRPPSAPSSSSSFVAFWRRRSTKGNNATRPRERRDFTSWYEKPSLPAHFPFSRGV